MLLDIQVDVEGGARHACIGLREEGALRCVFEGPSRWTVGETLELKESTQEVQTEQTEGQDWALERARTVTLRASRSTQRRRAGRTTRVCDENQRSSEPVKEGLLTAAGSRGRRD